MAHEMAHLWQAPMTNAATTKAKPDRRKIKYRCADCGGQVWGKPDLKLVCGEDGSEFVVAASKPKFLPYLEGTSPGDGAERGRGRVANPA
jgi:hypothetical protein